MFRFKNNLFKTPTRRGAFTMVEVAAAIALLSIILTSVLVLTNRCVSSVMDLQFTQQAFELARGNMEQLLSESRLSDMAEFGTSETNPDIEWETRVEPFYEPVTNEMWIRAVCSAGFTDSKGELKNIELEHWITNLTAAQVQQILAQQQVEAEYLSLLSDDQESVIQETTAAYLKEEGLDYEAYQRFSDRQRRKKLEYISENGFEGYAEYVETLKDEENEFLEELGMDFDSYNIFAASYVPQGMGFPDLNGDVDSADNINETDSPQSETDSSNSYKPEIDWDQVPPELVPIVEKLTGSQKTE